MGAIVSVDRSTAKPKPQPLRADRPAFLGRAPRPPSGLATGSSNGSIPPERFGYVTVTGEPKDLFVHVSILQRSGVGALEPSQAVQVEVVAGHEGDEIGAPNLS